METRYQQVASLVEAQISSGALRASDRIPSVRAMSRSAGVSVSTVVQAYLELEQRGLIESRPKSGFYVRRPDRDRLPEPKRRNIRSLRPRSVSAEVLDTCREAMTEADIVPFNSAIVAPEIYPNKKLNRLIREVLRDQPGHAGSVIVPPGHEELRRQIARQLSAFGAPTDLEEVVITSGTMDAINLSLGVLCQPGDTVLIESPTYFGILSAVERLQLRVLEVPNHPGSGLDVDALARLVENTKIDAAVLMPNFNNPVGSLTPEHKKRDIVEILSRAGVPTIEDDIYGDLYFDGTRPKPLRAFDNTDNVITCGSVSKTVALGYRVGWAISGQYAQDIARAKFLNSVAAPTLFQEVLARYFRGGGYDRYLSKLRALLSVNAARVLDGIAAHFPPGTRAARPAGGLLVWIELPKNVDSVELANSALSQRIGITPGIVFSAKADYRNYIRLNCGVNWNDELEGAIARLGKLVRQHC